MPKSVPRRRNLNERYLRSLKPEPKDYLVHDTFQRGLAIRVRTSGNMTWLCIYRHHGRKRDYLIGNYGAIDLEQARQIANEVMYKVVKGEDPAAVRAAQRSAGSFEDLLTRYAAYIEGRNKSWQQGERLVARYLKPKWAKLPAAAITRGDVKALFNAIGAPILANQVLAAASARFSWAIKNDFGAVTVNPCIGVERNPINERDRILSEAELPQFWRAFDNHGLINSNVLKLILLTGQRPDECCSIRSEHIVDIVTDGAWWQLPGRKIPALDWPGTKNGEDNEVWLSPLALEIIAKMENVGRIFPRANVENIDRAMRLINKALRVNDPVKPHDLRRTCGSAIAELSNTELMDRILNHKLKGVRRVYNRYNYRPEIKRVMLAVALKFQSLITIRQD
jgi:integrase